MAAHPGIEAARGAAWLAKQAERALQEADLSMPQYRMLSLLEGGGATATFVANRLAVRPPSVTAIVDGLEARSLVSRSAVAGDRRRVELAITEAGTEALARADAAIERQLRALTTHGSGARSADDALDALAWWLEAIRTEITSRLED